MVYTKEFLLEIIKENPKNFYKMNFFNFICKNSTLPKTQAIYNYIKSIEIPKCQCGQELKFVSFTDGYSYCKNLKCEFRKIAIVEKSKQTCLAKYGVDNAAKSEIVKKITRENNIAKYGVESHNSLKEIKLKKKETCLEKYGVENPNQVEEFKNKSKETCLEKYGVEYTLQSSKIREASKNTLFSNYGVHNPSLSEEVKEKKKQTCLEKYGVENHMKSKEFSDKVKYNKWITFYSKNKDNLCFIPLDCYKPLEQNDLVKVKDCGHIVPYFDFNGPLTFRCTECFPINANVSLVEKELLKYIKTQYSGEIIENDRTLLNGKELDIYIPELKLAFEFNGLYWHSSKNLEEEYLFKNKHLEKTDLCSKQNINLFHLTDYDWVHKRSIIESMINQKLGLSNRLYARKCTIKEIPYKEAKEFLDINHLQGSVTSKINIGLFYEEELVSLMTFGKPRFNKNYEWELIRFCNKLDHTVIGGASKLLKYFINKYEGSIISYADRCHSNGELYFTLGFKYVDFSEPSYFWWKNSTILSRHSTQKHKLKNLLKENFDEDKTESENMYKVGFKKYFNTGNFIFIRE